MSRRKYIEVIGNDNKEEEVMEEKVGFIKKVANGAKKVWESKPVQYTVKVGKYAVPAVAGALIGLAIGGRNSGEEDILDDVDYLEVDDKDEAEITVDVIEE